MNSSVLVGHVVSVMVRPPVAALLSTPILLEIQTEKGNSTSVKSRSCVYLDTNSLDATWRTDGCRVHAFNTTHTTCACSHLTNFAVLMQVTHIQLSQAARVSLEVLTVMGCTVSIAALSFTITIHIWLRMWSQRILLLLNLSGALAVAQIVFLAGVDATNNRATCQAIAILLHYLYLSVFSLMLVEGIQLNIKMYLVFRRDGKLLPFIVAAWSLPLLIVGLSVGLDVNGYGTSFSCWLSVEEGTIWAFVGPVLVIVGFNVFVLGLVIKTFLKLKINAKKTECQKLISSVKATAVLLPLLGITWTFGILALNSNTLAFQYLFALLNAFQGLFIFLSNVVYNDEVKVAYWKRRGRVQTVQSVHTHSTATVSITEARRKVFAGFLSTHI
ncbi:adhesion G-protein coupled receptor D1-like [Gigantopelta aegis]|uniref:adhesion G-protein coupled receptor D1-like n=1 Tax=Gigantopelta aegis TaxID=1735272 RepID=UPI001B88B3F8|nr:adhesion G-protein coupled receptor D1-like [Gigantopelta aegis]